MTTPHIVVNSVAPSPGLRDRVKSSQDFTFGHPLPQWGRGAGGEGRVEELRHSCDVISTSTCSNSLDLAAIRARLSGTQGPQYYRSLEEIAETEEFQEFLHREFPQGASEWSDPVGRRQFLKLM